MEIAGAKRSFRFRIGTKQQPLPDLDPSITSRVTSIDLLRGLVMIIMALDHTRDYFNIDAYQFDPTDLSRTNAALFFTRFVTHYCAPTFMLLSGTSAYLVGMRKGKKALSTFLLTRGLWLVLLELTVVNFGWFFDVHYNNTGTLVIWALGMSMIFLAALVHLPKTAILGIGLAMIFGHNLLDNIQVTSSPGQYFWAVVHQQNIFQFKGIAWFAMYPLVPWVGVMSLGYCLGSWYTPAFDSAKRKKLLLQAGVACTLLFITLRFTNWYGDRILWSEQPTSSLTVLSFFSVSKYPPSLLYLLVTLGPAFIFLSVTEKSNGWFGKRIQVIGRVPMFYYLVHIYLIHMAAMVAAQLTVGLSWKDMILESWVSNNPKLQAGFGYSLGTTYLIWMGLIFVLYFMCKWYDAYKRTHKHWWLSYL
jgi:uncharacterized membrane protein